MATWTGWVADIDAPITLITEDHDQLALVQRELSRIGVDRLAGAHTGALDGVALATRTSATFPQLARTLRSGSEIALVDVRDPGEWAKGHLRGAVHIPAYEITDHDLPDQPWLYCGVGFRAAIAASVLARAGRAGAVVIDDQLARARKSGLPWCEGTACPDDRCTAAHVPAASRR